MNKRDYLVWVEQLKDIWIDHGNDCIAVVIDLIEEKQDDLSYEEESELIDKINSTLNTTLSILYDYQSEEKLTEEEIKEVTQHITELKYID